MCHVFAKKRLDTYKQPRTPKQNISPSAHCASWFSTQLDKLLHVSEINTRKKQI